MASGLYGTRAVDLFNAVVARLIDAPVVGPFVRRGMVEIRYEGRRSGRTFQTPIYYRRTSDGVIITVMAPDSKTWWRNFSGDGAPLTLMNFDGADRAGHAVATRNERGRVTVKVAL
ncbi:hypothetical protein [Mycobacterium sp. 236(2023)]|uniref:hypothetical protein n=1 Tax=Mycobacterium sp. 236(2023) TaxID=3038163 RepID=UPI0024154C35|nr:hypothetical protein [Mycobacterium sp. 236(2023)]MDG4666625.1 hypothetical protein [Mycobacterium sp. 236(2023)]